MLKHTAFYDFHQSLNARMVDFEGWEMPLLYRSIVDEHEQTRKSGSIFDVSHMGRLYFSGSDTKAFLNQVFTREVGDQQLGQSRYGLICNEAGGVMDDVIVSRDTKNWIMVCNAGNREKLVDYFVNLRQKLDLDFDLSDQTMSTGMVAIQGPKVIERLSQALPVDVSGIQRHHFQTTSFMMIKFTAFRSGYTGEDGIELVLPARMAPMAIKMLGGKMDKPDATLKPAGLGARDTLRLESGLPLYGHELTEEIDPLSAGLKWAVNLEKDFIGAEALRKIQAQGPARKLVGLELAGKRIARQGMKVLADGKQIGVVTSGTFGPTVQKSIAMAYVQADQAAEGTAVQVDIKGESEAATVVKRPFYRREGL